MTKAVSFIRNLELLVVSTLILNFLISFCRFMTMPFMIIYFSKSSALTYEQIGIIIGLSSLSSLIFALFAGKWADNVGVKIALPVSLLIPAFCFIGYLSTSNFYLLSLFSATSGIAWAIYNSSNMTILAKFSKDLKEEVFGLNYWLFNLGAVVGPILGAYLGSGNSTLVIYVFVVVLIFSSISLYFLFLKKDTQMHTSSESDKPENFTKTLKQLFSKKAILFMLLAYFSLFFVQSQIETSIGLFLKDTFEQIGVKIFAYSLSLSAFVILFFQPIFIWLLKKSKEIQVFIAGTVLIALGTISYTFINNAYLMLIPIFLISIGEVVYTPKLQALVANLAEEKMQSTYFALLNMSGNLAFFIGPWLGTVLLGYNSFMLFSTMTLIVLIGGYAILKSFTIYSKSDKASEATEITLGTEIFSESSVNPEAHTSQNTKTVS